MRELVKKLIPRRLFEAVEPTGHWLEAVLANVRYGFPARGLNVIGVTGTDGKTTTTTLIAAMLRDAGLKVGYMTTISLDYGDGARPNPTRLTTITSAALFRALRQMKAAGLDWVVLETTSHALAQHRVWGVPYSVAVMTNVTHEHLDYHRTFERYRDAKLRLFQLTGGNKRGLGVGIVNAEDPSAQLFARAVPRPITYGQSAGDLRASEVQTSPTGSHFVASYQGQRLELQVNLPGSFNVMNALAAAGVGLALELSPEQIAKGIASLEQVEGRMSSIDEGQDFSVIIDYAHTPDSFQKVIQEVRPLTTGRLIAVFGSAGRRDEAKRELQGKIAGELCDMVVVTEEDDRDQDGLGIMHQIADGAKAAGKVPQQDLFEIHDRAQAIDFAVQHAQAGDCILLLGKGHEKSILTNQGKKDWDEAGAARAAIKHLK